MLKTTHYFNSVNSKEKKEAKAYIQKKLQSWDKFFKKTKFPPKAEVRIEFRSKKKRYFVQIELESAIGKIVGSSEKQNLLEAIDEVVKDLRIQFRRNKSKMITLSRRRGRSIKKRFAIDKSSRFRFPDSGVKKKISGYWEKYFK